MNLQTVRISVDSGGMRMAWIGQIDSDTPCIERAAVAAVPLPANGTLWPQADA
ncbi:MAG: hypothetical protein OQK79_09855 [Rhodanobacter sp.]|nr:hypothetical protein [Rhodanobacter sp.]